MDSRDDPDDQNDMAREKLMPGTHPKDYEATEKRQVAPKKELSVIPHERNWKGIVISIIVIAFVIAIVAVCAFFLQPHTLPASYKYSYEIESMFSYSWMPHSVTGSWIGENLFYRDREQNFIQRNGPATKILISNETLNDLDVAKVSISPDLKYALLSYNVGKVYRHSSLSEFYIYTIATGDYVPLHDRQLQYAAWGGAGNQITYVLDYDLYYKSGVDASPVAVSASGAGSNGKIVNGIADWVYEEEMFLTEVANWISNDGSYLAYVTFNDTLVPEVDLIVYTKPYTTLQKVNYPKSGFPNPTVTVHFFDVESNETIKVRIPESLEQKAPVLNSFVWVSGNESIVTWSNRYQNTSVVTYCVVPSNFQNHELGLECKIIHEETADGWIENIGRKPFIGPGRSIFRIQEKKQGGNGNFHHILHIDYSADPATRTYLTTGKWEVTKIVGYYPSEDRLYFISTKTSPTERHLYSVNIAEYENTLTCITCDAGCGYIDASMSADSEWILLNCMGPGVPRSFLYNGEDSVIMEANTVLAERFGNAKMPVINYETITITGELGTYDFQAKLYLPPGLDEKHNIPLLLSVYAGPGSQQVSEAFLLDYTTYLVANKGIAVLVFDGRGSGYRGSNAMKEVSRRLGQFEIEDQITALREVLKRHPYLDKNKVGVWGWSYGGYATMQIATHADILKDNMVKCAMSVAPVTDWTLYDSLYTERYMGSTKDNFLHYQQSSLLDKAYLFDKFKFLLIHGTQDDNVHFQNSALMEKELVFNQIMHQYQVYIDEAHGLMNHGIFTQLHLYHLMTQFLFDCYGST